jgi:hypothetical protein
MPGMGEEMEGAKQQAPHKFLHCIKKGVENPLLIYKFSAYIK